ncbi:MAG: hypothetical protein IPL43_02530 [Micropruina sp.]|nr:hypothetical protein [Micropruina sp.]
MVSVAGVELPIAFASGAETFELSLTGASLSIGDLVTIEGDFAASPTSFAGRNLTVFVGDGPAFLVDGNRNPLARGLLITDGIVGFISKADGYVLDVRGTVELIGFPGVTVSGQLRARVNESADGEDSTLTFPDGSGDVILRFTDGTGGTDDETGSPGSPFVSVVGVGLEIGVMGQTFTGDLSFSKTSAGMTIGASNVSLTFSDGSTDLLSLTNGSGEFQLSSAGVAAVVAGTLNVTLPGFTLGAGVRLAINTTAAQVVFNPAGTTLDATLAAGPYLRLTGSAITLTVGGQSLTAGTLEIERRIVDGSPLTRITLIDGTLSLGDGTTTFLGLDNIDGSLVIGAGGIAGRLSAEVDTLAIPGVSLASVSLAINTAAVAVDDLPAGPYLAIEALGASITVGGQTLSADLGFQRSTTAEGTSVVLAAVTNLSFVVTAGGRPVASLSQGQGILMLAADGMAARVSGTVLVDVPGVSFSGSLELELNTTPALVNQVLAVGGEDVLLALPAGALGADYLRFAATDVTLDVLGQHLSGNLIIERDGSSTRVLVSDAELVLAGGIATVTGASADLTIVAAGLHGTFTGAIAFNVPGVSLAASVTVDVDTRLASRHLLVLATGVELDVAGQSLRGNLSLEQGTNAAGEQVLKLAIVNTTPVDPLLTLTAGGNDLLTIEDATGLLVLSTAGAAGSLDVTNFVVSLPGGLSLTAESIRVEVNTGTAAVTETFNLGGSSTTLTLPAGPYVSVRVLGAELDLGTPVLSGNFAFEQGTAPDGTAITVVAATEVTVDVTIGTDGATLVDGEGAFVILSTGLAGYLSGRANLSAGPVSAGADILLRVNTSTAAVDTSIELGGRTLVVKFATGNVFEVSLSNLSLTIADFLTIEGSVSFSDTTIGGQAAQVFAGEGLTVFLGRGPAKLSTGETNPLAMGVLLSNGRIGLIKIGATYALFAEGTISLVGVSGVTISGTVIARVNNTGQIINQTLEIPGSTGAGVLVSFPTTALVTEFAATGATLAVAGQSLTGNVGFSKNSTGDVVIAASEVTLSLGGVVSVTDAEGLFVLGATGLAGRLTGLVDVAVPGVGFTGDFSVVINNTLAPVNTSFELAGETLTLDLPAGPFLRVEGLNLGVEILGQTLQADVLIERSVANGSPVTTIALARVELSLGSGTYGVRITGGSGLFLVTAAGLAGRISGTIVVSLPAGTSLNGALSLAVNTTTAAVSSSVTVGSTTLSLNLPAGPYLRFEGTDVVLTVLGQSLSGNLAIEKSTSYGDDGVPGGLGVNADSSTVRIALSEVTLALGGATVLTLSNGSAVLLLAPTGLAGRITGDIALTVPQVSLSGSLAVEINTTASEVTETFTVGTGAPITLDLPTGPYLRVAGTDVQLSILGQTLAGDFVITRTTTASGPVTRIQADNLSLRIGGTEAAPILTLTQSGSAEFLISSAGIAGQIAVSLALSVPAVSVTGTIAISVNTTTSAAVLAAGTLQAGPYLRVAGTGVTINVLGQSLSADVTFEQATTATGAKVVRIGLANARLILLGTNADPTIGLVNGSGLFVIGPTGLAGSFSGDLVFDVPNVSLVGSLSVQVNNTGLAVSESLQVGAGTVSLALPPGPYLRIAGEGLRLRVAGQSLSGDVVIEQATSVGPDGILNTADDVRVLRIAAANVNLTLGDGVRNFLTVTDGSALFVINDLGLAGSVGGTVELLNVPGVTLAGTLQVEVNSTGADVDETFVIAGQTRELLIPAEVTLRVRGTGITLAFGGQSLSADIEITKSTASLQVLVANGRLVLGTPTQPLVTVTDIEGTLVLTSGGLYGQVSAAVQLEIPAITLSGAFQLRFNTTIADAVIQTAGAATSELSDDEFLTLTPGIRVAAIGVLLTIAGQSLGGNVVIERRAGLNPEVSIAFADLTLSLGTAVVITAEHDWTGAILITPTSIAATFSGSLGGGAVDPVFNLGSSITLGGTVSLQINNGPLAVNRSFDVVLPDDSTETIVLDVPAGPFFQLAITGGTLAVGPVSFAGSFVIAQSTKPGFGGLGSGPTTTRSPPWPPVT